MPFPPSPSPSITFPRWPSEQPRSRVSDWLIPFFSLVCEQKSLVNGASGEITSHTSLLLSSGRTAFLKPLIIRVNPTERTHLPSRHFAIHSTIEPIPEPPACASTISGFLPPYFITRRRLVYPFSSQYLNSVFLLLWCDRCCITTNKNFQVFILALSFYISYSAEKFTCRHRKRVSNSICISSCAVFMTTGPDTRVETPMN